MGDFLSDNKPNLVIFFEAGSLFSYPFNIKEYLESYLDFIKEAQSRFNIFVVRGRDKYLGQGRFKEGYSFKKGKFVSFAEPIKAEVIYDKGNLNIDGGKSWSVVNKAGLNEICNDKFKTYQIFKKFHKFTCKFETKRQAKQCLKKMNEGKIVYKPRYGFEGRGIIIDEKNKIIEKIKDFKAGLFQDFIDTSQGVEKICHECHDLRVTVMNGEIIQTYVRLPKKGSLISNVAQGGKLKEFTVGKLDSQLRKIVNEVDRYFKQFGARIYAIDFGIEAGRPYIIEINNAPGLPYKKWEIYYHFWHQKLLATLVAAFKNKNGK